MTRTDETRHSAYIQTQVHEHTHANVHYRTAILHGPLVKVLLEQVGFEGTFEGGEGFGMSKVKRE